MNAHHENPHQFDPTGMPTRRVQWETPLWRVQDEGPQERRGGFVVMTLVWMVAIGLVLMVLF